MDELKLLVKEFLDILDVKEESDSGTTFSPVYISSCRCMTSVRVNEILIKMKELVE